MRFKRGVAIGHTGIGLWLFVGSLGTGDYEHRVIVLLSGILIVLAGLPWYLSALFDRWNAATLASRILITSDLRDAVNAGSKSVTDAIAENSIDIESAIERSTR